MLREIHDALRDGDAGNMGDPGLHGLLASVDQPASSLSP